MQFKILFGPASNPKKMSGLSRLFWTNMLFGAKWKAFVGKSFLFSKCKALVPLKRVLLGEDPTKIPEYVKLVAKPVTFFLIHPDV